MLPFFETHLFVAVDRTTCMKDDGENQAENEDFGTMYERTDERIEMQLPCRLEFPNVWTASVDGFTANLHRKGVSVACRVVPGKTLPEIGEQASVYIELPPNSDFPPKFMNCETTLLRIDALSDSEFQFALKIQNVDFAELSSAVIDMMELDTDSCRYVM